MALIVDDATTVHGVLVVGCAQRLIVDVGGVADEAGDGGGDGGGNGGDHLGLGGGA